MALTKKQQSTLRQLIRNYADMQEANSWKGGGDPESIPEIEEMFKKTKEKLFNYIKKLGT